MSVCNWFTIEIYGFTHSSCIFLTHGTQIYGFTHCLCAAQGAIAMEDSEDKDDGRLENESRDMEDG